MYKWSTSWLQYLESSSLAFHRQKNRFKNSNGPLIISHVWWSIRSLWNLWSRSRELDPTIYDGLLCRTVENKTSSLHASGSFWGCAQAQRCFQLNANVIMLTCLCQAGIMFYHFRAIHPLVFEIFQSRPKSGLTDWHLHPESHAASGCHSFSLIWYY